MDSVTATHVVAAALATSRELVELWRRMVGAGPRMTLSGSVVAIGWVGKAGQRIRATARATARDLADISYALSERPDCRFLLVEHHKRVKIIVLQRRCDVAAGKLITPSGTDSPLVVTYRPDDEPLAASR